MTAEELVKRFLESEEEYDFDIFREFDLEELGLDWVGSHEYIDETTDEDEFVSKIFTTVKFPDHNLIIQEIKTYEDNELTETIYCTAKEKVITQTIYVADEEIKI